MTSHQKPHINVITIGHASHGKTTLTAAIARNLTTASTIKPLDVLNNVPKERVCGVNISAAHVEYETEARHYGQVDWPSHADYAKNILIGGMQIDGAILVVSATDGPMSQTREQVQLARQAGVQYVVVFLNKCDVADGEKLEKVEMEVRQLLNKYDFPGENTPIVRGSAQRALEVNTGDLGKRSIVRLGEALDTYIPAPVEALSRPFLMPVEDVFSISGRGTVATGKIERGMIRIGDDVDIVGSGRMSRTTCVGVEMFKRQVDVAEQGEFVGVMLRGIKRDELERGFVLAMPGTAWMHTDFRAEAYMLYKSEGGRHTPFKGSDSPQFFFHRTDVTGVISELSGTGLVMPGDKLSITVKLSKSMAMEAGLHFAIREDGRTVGFGIVTSLL